MRLYKVMMLSAILALFSTTVLAGSIAGTVKNKSGQPVPGLELNAVHTTDSLAFITKSADDGTYVFNNLKAGMYYISVSDYNIPSSDLWGPYKVTENGTLENVDLIVDFTIVKNGGVRGQITDENGAAIANVKLTLTNNEHAFFPEITFSDNNGFYEFSTVPAGNWQLSALHPLGFNKTLQNALLIEADKITSGINIVFTEAELKTGTVLGKVINESGKGLSNVSVFLNSTNSKNYSDSLAHKFYTVQTDENGNYSIENIIPGAYNLTAYHLIGGYIKLPNMYNIEADKTTQIENIVFRNNAIASGTISGIVKVGEKPVKNAKLEFIPVKVDSDSSHLNNYYYTESDENGQYSAIVRPGKYIVSCSFNNDELESYFGYYKDAYNFNNATQIEVLKDQTTAGINFSIAKTVILSTVTISGRVTDENNAPISNADVRVNHFPHVYNCSITGDSSSFYGTVAKTDNAGNYTLTLKNVRSPHAQLTVSAYAHGYQTEFYNNQKDVSKADIIAPGAKTEFTHIDFSLEKDPHALSFTVSGKVSNEDGTAIADAEVLAYHTTLSSIISTRTDKEGNYTLSNFYTGDYVLMFYSYAHEPEYYNDKINWEEADKINLTASLSNINAVLKPFKSDSSKNTISGLISDENGEVLQGVWVALKNKEGKTFGHTISDISGRYRIQGVNEYNALTVTANKVQYDYKTEELSNPITKSHLQIHNISLQKTKGTTGIKATQKSIFPSQLTLLGNYPNPFNPNTKIAFKLKQPANVSITIYNVLGQQIALLGNRVYTAGTQTINWNGKNRNGLSVQSGLYFYHILAQHKNGQYEIKTSKMTLLK